MIKKTLTFLLVAFAIITNAQNTLDVMVVSAENKEVLIIGAGGVSPSVIFALQKSKVKKVSIINRTFDKSLFLKKKI